jgi:hypothetical protein
LTLTTTNYGFPYPESSDPPNGPAQFSALATGVDTSLNTVAGYVGSWTTWTPTYTGLTIGNGTLQAVYKQDISKTGSKTIHFKWRLVSGSTTAYSATQVSFTLPVARNATPGREIFTGHWLHAGEALCYDVIGDTTTASTTVVKLFALAPLSNDRTPIDLNITGIGFETIINTDTIFVSGTYRGA